MTLLTSDYSNQPLDLTANTMLETLTLYGGDDSYSHTIDLIDLSNNPNINDIHTTGIWELKLLDLQSGTSDVSNLDIDISVGFPLQSGDSNEVLNENLFCIKVTDEAAATAGTGVYSTWTITAESNPYYFSETCSLNTERFKDFKVSIYPNPATDFLNVESKSLTFSTVRIYSLTGQLVMSFDGLNTNSVDVSALKSGHYILNIVTEFGTIKKKFLKK